MLGARSLERPFGMRPNRAPIRRRWLALCLASLYVASTAASFAHLATTQHARCPDHGELIHVEAVAHDVDVDVDAPSELPSVARGGVAGEPHHHDHCAVAPIVEGSAPLVTIASEAPPPSPCRDPAPLPGDTAFVTLARYLIAPKTSPPHA